MEKQRSYKFLSLLFILLLCWRPCAATEETSPIRQIEQYQRQILSLKEDIAIQQKLKEKENARAGLILAQMEKLDTQLLQQQKKLRTLVTSAAEKKKKIKRQEKELTLLQKKRDAVTAQLQKRSAALYTMGKIGLINATFSRKTLPGLLTLKDSFDTLLQQDQELLLHYQDTLELHRKKQHALKRENVALATLITQTTEQKRRLQLAKEKKRSRLAEIRKQKELRKQAIKELHNASTELSNSIARIKDNIVQQQKKFQKNKGHLPLPVKGGMVATEFQQITTNAFGEKTYCDGIEIESPDNAKVIAIEGGKVYFAGYLQGFGNTIIINHGMHYYSILSRLEEIMVKKGAKVHSGQQIARAGESATLFTKGVYFEIRKHQQQLDPLLWINPYQVIFIR